MWVFSLHGLEQNEGRNAVSRRERPRFEHSVGVQRTLPSSQEVLSSQLPWVHGETGQLTQCVTRIGSGHWVVLCVPGVRSAGGATCGVHAGTEIGKGVSLPLGNALRFGCAGEGGLCPQFMPTRSEKMMLTAPLPPDRERDRGRE